MDKTVNSSKEPEEAKEPKKPNKQIGHYEIKSELGRGGMATVYLGYDKRFEREVAVKVLPVEFLHDPQFSVRFHREAKTVAALEHPAIVPVYDVGESEEGLHYFVMRYMDGGSLAEKLAKGDISLKEVARIVSIIAPALDDAHEKGIIHRDLKPANILFDQRGRPYLSDFGIAKISGAQQDVTGSAIIGTPAYMSPEQAQGKEVDGRSDIYALGAIIYRMLTGTRPYSGDTPMSMAIKHITDPTPDILEDNPALPLAMSAFIYRAMEKDPDARFQTAVELANILDALANHKSTEGLKTLSSHTKLSMTKIGAKIAVPPKKEKKKKVGWIFGIIALLALAGLGFALKAFLPADVVERTPSPTLRVASTSPPNTLVPPSLTPTSPPVPTEADLPTETPVPANNPILGGTDKVAFIANNEVWMMNIDGSDLEVLTTDGSQKIKLQWMPDGKTLIYLVGKCIQTVDVEEDRVDVVSCFQQAEYFEAFQISPSGEQIAMSINRELFILPFNLDELAKARTRSDLQRMEGGCFYAGESVIDVRWHDNEEQIAILFAGTSLDGNRADLIRVIDITNCQSAASAVATGTAVAESVEDDDYKLFFIDQLDEFPASRFTMSGYNSNTPYIPEFDWDGDGIFLMNTFKRNDGYGYFYTYNTHSHKAEQLDPVGVSTCCYRDARWSPDGTHFMVAYQDIALGSAADTLFYFVRFGTLGSGVNYDPIPMPEGFFENLKEMPQFALRPAEQ
ncbi:MAG: serine/threonine-protein kinase [Anaerolineae bacterium]|nr:serine/threonine-protein kinase [Anaerolineae bacterium]MBT7073436.1 serine/threonine-protein kinase [Anaerolineae bacterium]MBT7781809.1 serine/threonine-protein kinase [Anaerolineae bacterium]